MEAGLPDKTYNRIMAEWDYWRKQIFYGDTSSAPRDWFESILQEINDINEERNSNEKKNKSQTKNPPQNQKSTKTLLWPRKDN